MKRFGIFNKNTEEPITMSYFENIDQAYHFYKELKRFTSNQFDKLFVVKEVK